MNGVCVYQLTVSFSKMADVGEWCVCVCVCVCLYQLTVPFSLYDGIVKLTARRRARVLVGEGHEAVCVKLCVLMCVCQCVCQCVCVC